MGFDPFSAGADLLGSLLSYESSRSANATNLMMAQQNLEFQKEASKSGLQWRAADATAAEGQTGINRLALMGAPTFSPSPVSAGQVADTGTSEGLHRFGQDLSRASEAMSAENVRKASLESKLLEAQIANVNADTVGKQASASRMVTGAPKTPGIGPLYTQYRAPDGSIVILPSKDASSSLQNAASFPANLAIGGDMLRRNLRIPDHPLDATWEWIKRHGNADVRGDVLRSTIPVLEGPS